MTPRLIGAATDVIPQQNLRQLAADRGESLANLSALIGRDAAYLQQFVARGSPWRLDDDDRLFLAQHLNVSERLLGARDPWGPCG